MLLIGLCNVDCSTHTVIPNSIYSLMDMFTAVCRWMHPLQITLPQTAVPIVGSLLGWVIGVSALPHGIPTYLGGALLMIATVMVLTAGHVRESRQHQQQAQQDIQMPAVQTVLSKSVGQPGAGAGEDGKSWDDESLAAPPSGSDKNDGDRDSVGAGNAHAGASAVGVDAEGRAGVAYATHSAGDDARERQGGQLGYAGHPSVPLLGQLRSWFGWKRRSADNLSNAEQGEVSGLLAEWQPTAIGIDYAPSAVHEPGKLAEQI